MDDEIKAWRKEIEEFREETDCICREAREIETKLTQAVQRLADQIDENEKSQKELRESFDKLVKEIS